jgi:hypothetical protein
MNFVFFKSRIIREYYATTDKEKMLIFFYRCRFITDFSSCTHYRYKIPRMFNCWFEVYQKKNIFDVTMWCGRSYFELRTIFQQLLSIKKPKNSTICKYRRRIISRYYGNKTDWLLQIQISCYFVFGNYSPWNIKRGERQIWPTTILHLLDLMKNIRSQFLWIVVASLCHIYWHIDRFISIFKITSNYSSLSSRIGTRQSILPIVPLKIKSPVKRKFSKIKNSTTNYFMTRINTGCKTKFYLMVLSSKIFARNIQNSFPLVKMLRTNKTKIAHLDLQTILLISRPYHRYIIRPWYLTLKCDLGAHVLQYTYNFQNLKNQFSFHLIWDQEFQQ